MKKIVLVLITILVMTFGHSFAAEWHTKEATSALLDKDYQLNIIMLYCSEKYETETMFKQCVMNQAEAYMDVYHSIEFLHGANQDGFDVSKPMECLAYSLSVNWEPEFDCANWISVQRHVQICMDE